MLSIKHVMPVNERTKMSIIEFLAQTDAPWSAALIGTVIGGLITWLVTKSSDARKAKRDKAERIMIDSRTASLEFIDAVDSLSGHIRRQRGPQALEHRYYLRGLQDCISEVRSKHSKVEIYADHKILESAKELLASTFLLLVPIASDEEARDVFEKHDVTKIKFINAIRVASGVKAIVENTPTQHEREEMRSKINETVEVIGAGLEAEGSESRRS